LPRPPGGIVVSNRLLAGLPRGDRERFVAGGERVRLEFGEVLCEPGQRIRHVYFPADGFVSLAAPVDSRASLEVGLIGNEGMLGIPLVLGIAVSAQRALVRGAGDALRMPAASFHRELQGSTALQRGLNRYLYALMAQFADGRVHALPLAGSAPGPLAPDDARPRPLGRFSSHA
jgi:acid stress-induced BolA-like protein IbaG/YrbA